MSEGDPVPPGALFVPPAVAPAEDEAEQTSRRRRSVVSSSQRIVLTSMVGGAAILRTLSPGAPTGHDVVGAVYRAVFVAVLALAASRRRWSVIISAAIATAASVGFGLIFAGAALLMAVFLVGRDLRNRVYGTCVGAFIRMACLRLDVGWFLGAPAVLAIISAGLVMWSGSRVSRRRTRRVIRWAVAVVALVMVVGVGMAVYEALAFSSSLEKAVGATTDGVSSLQSGSTEAAAEQFEGAKDRFRDVADSSRAWWLFPARMVPVVGHNIEAVTVLSEAGASLTGAAGRISAEVDYTALRREGGGVDLGLLATFRGPVLDAASGSGQRSTTSGDSLSVDRGALVGADRRVRGEGRGVPRSDRSRCSSCRVRTCAVRRAGRTPLSRFARQSGRSARSRRAHRQLG